MFAQNKCKLLLIDDDPSMVRLLTKVIERGMSDEVDIESLTDPSAAREKIESEHIDILITDLEMPEVNGLELLGQAKKKNPCTQVLFLTGHSTHQALLEAMDLGASDYLLKPVDHAELLALLKQAHGRQARWKKALAETWRTRNATATAT